MQNNSKNRFFGFWTLAAIFKLNMVSRRSGRYLKTFPRLVASSWLNMSPWRAMATPFVPKMIHWRQCSRTISRLCDKSREFPCGAASGGNFSRKNTHLCNKSRELLGRQDMPCLGRQLQDNTCLVLADNACPVAGGGKLLSTSLQHPTVEQNYKIGNF